MSDLRAIVGDVLLALSVGMAVYIIAVMTRKCRAVVIKRVYRKALGYELLICGVLLLLSLDVRFDLLEACLPLRIVLAVLNIFLLAVAAKVVAGGMHQNAGEVEYALVLGVALEDGRPTVDMMRRLSAAADYARKRPAATLIVTGGNGGGGMPSEAGVMREVLLAKGIGADRIAMEDQSDDTRANFTNVARMIDPANPIVIITTGCHMDRAVRLAGETGFRDVRRLPVPSEPVNAISNVLWEVVMALNHILTGR